MSVFGLLTKIDRARLLIGYVPTAWRRNRAGEVTPYRGTFTLVASCFIQKTVESFVDRYNRDESPSRKTSSDGQHAYQMERSTKKTRSRVVYLLEDKVEARPS